MTQAPDLAKDAEFEHLHPRGEHGRFSRVGALIASLARVHAGGAFHSRENPDAYMDWATVLSNGNFDLEAVGDDGGLVRFEMTPAELGGLHAALTNKVAVMGQAAEADDPGGYWPDGDHEDGRWFDWSDEVDEDHYRLDLGAPDGHGGFIGTTIDMSSLDMQEWHTALTITLLTHAAADKGQEAS